MSKSNGTHLEIERKYLIEHPDERLFAEISGSVRYEIEQIYLNGNDNETERIRMCHFDNKIQYFHTIKKIVSSLTRIEEENEISLSAYRALKESTGKTPMIIEKTRWCIPHDGLMIEIDIYPFWINTAIAEIELEREDGHVSFPDCIKVIREVTQEEKYSNRALAAALRDGSVKNLDVNN